MHWYRDDGRLDRFDGEWCHRSIWIGISPWCGTVLFSLCADCFLMRTRVDFVREDLMRLATRHDSKRGRMRTRGSECFSGTEPMQSISKNGWTRSPQQVEHYHNMVIAEKRGTRKSSFVHGCTSCEAPYPSFSARQFTVQEISQNKNVSDRRHCYYGKLGELNASYHSLNRDVSLPAHRE
jgi:hypothetical protein